VRRWRFRTLHVSACKPTSGMITVITGPCTAYAEGRFSHTGNLGECTNEGAVECAAGFDTSKQIRKIPPGMPVRFPLPST